VYYKNTMVKTLTIIGTVKKMDFISDLEYGRRKLMSNIPLIHKQRLLQKIYRNVQLDKRVLTYEKKPVIPHKIDIKV